MEKIILDFLRNIPKDDIIKELSSIFKSLLQEIEIFFNLEKIKPSLILKYNPKEKRRKELKDKVFDFGVKKSRKNNLITLEIFKESEKFIHQILLREAFKCFVPESIEDNEIVNVFIHKIIIKILRHIPNTGEWENLIRQKIVSSEYLNLQFHHIDDYLNMKAHPDENPVGFFFKFIKKNAFQIEEIRENFFHLLISEYTFKTSKSMKNDEILETIRILVMLFYRIKTYRTLKDYKYFFNEFRKKGLVSTNLSLRQFVKNLRWINQYTPIAPSYQTNWDMLGIYVFICYIKFNPLIPNNQIIKIIEIFPFFIDPKFSINSFTTEIIGYFVIPAIYTNDLESFLDKLKDNGYVINKLCMKALTNTNFLNLNYLRESYKDGQIVNIYHQNYEKKYEIEFNLKYAHSLQIKPLEMIDWILLDRINSWLSVEGVGFDKRAEILKRVKSDLIDLTLSQIKIIGKLNQILQKFNDNPQSKRDFLTFLNRNKSYGFLYIKEFLSNLLTHLKSIASKLLQDPYLYKNLSTKDIEKFFDTSNSLEYNVLFNENNLKKPIMKEFLSLSFDSSSDLKDNIKKYEFYLNFFNLCAEIKIFDVKSMKNLVENISLVEKVYDKRKIMLKSMYEKYKHSEITIQSINKRVQTLLMSNPPVIKPSLISTILLRYPFYPLLVLKDNFETRKQIKKIKHLFPRVFIVRNKELSTNKKLVLLHLHLINLEKKEIEMLFSILYKIFKDNILIFKRFYYEGILKTYSRKDYYDFNRKEFFYSPHLFNERFSYIQKLIGNTLKKTKKPSDPIKEKFWPKNYEFVDLISKINKRKSSIDSVDFDIKDLTKLHKFHRKLEDYIINPEKFNIIKNEYFIKNYVKSIRFKPAFSLFGLAEYYFYFHPINLKNLDFKLLILNSFQYIKHSAWIEESNSFFVKILFPYSNPNMSYINWLTNTAKNLREYCLFFVKKLYHVLHFDYNLTSEGWAYDSRRFKNYVQNLLLNPDYKMPFPDLKQFEMNKITDSSYYGSDSPFFEKLSQIYNWHSNNIKRFLNLNHRSKLMIIQEFLKKNFIFPYITLKNLDLLEELIIILPDIKPELNEDIVKIFSFFNFGFIYETEGQYFIYGFDKEKKFENGLMIKLYLPSCELHEFIKLFDLLFQYLRIKKYLYLNNLIDGNNLIKNIFGNLDFLKSYNPLKNLKWNTKDKIWTNHKLYTKEFNPIYPDLYYNEKEMD